MPPSFEQLNAALFSDKLRLARTLTFLGVSEEHWGDVIQCSITAALLLPGPDPDIALSEWMHSVLLAVLIRLPIDEKPAA